MILAIATCKRKESKMIYFNGIFIIVDSLPIDICDYVREECYKSPLHATFDEDDGYIISLEDFAMLLCELNISSFTPC